MNALPATARGSDILDVLICGAGAAGLTLAIELARRGRSIALIEKRSGPFEGSRGKGIQPRTQEVFEDIGILDRIMSAGSPYPPLRSYVPGREPTESDMMEVHPASTAEPYVMPRMVPQFRTEAILRDRLAELGHHPRYDHRLVGFEDTGDGVEAQIQTPGGPRHMCARYLVGTDGGRSFVRKHLGIAFRGRTFKTRAIVADLRLAGLDRAAWHRFVPYAAGEATLLCPLAGTDLFQLHAPVALDSNPDLSRYGLEAMLVERTGRRDIEVVGIDWASVYTMGARLADRYQVGRILLAGDAAHTHPPTGAQGLNTSVQDAYNLGWKLSAALDGAPGRILSSYEDERRPVAKAMIDLTVNLLTQTRQGAMRRGRDTRQLDIAYPGSPLATLWSRPGGRVSAGDRAPDAPLRSGSGHKTRLFNFLAGPHWTLLGLEHAGARIEARAGLRVLMEGEDFVDADRLLRSTYDVGSKDWIAIRPDGHVGGITEDGAAILSFLDDMGLRT